MLPGRIHHWSISETPAMAAAGQSLSNDPDLSFHNDIASAATRLGSRDLTIAQGVLQYAGDPLQLLAGLFALEFSYVYVTRTAVANVDAPVFTKQDTELSAHGPGQLPDAPNGRSSQPMTLVSWEALAATIPSNYEIVFQFVESEERSLLIGNRTINVRDVGFLAASV